MRKLWALLLAVSLAVTPAFGQTLTNAVNHKSVIIGGGPSDGDGGVSIDVTGLISGATIASPSFTGILKLPDGTVGAPSLTFTSDTDLGLYFISAGVMGISVGGSLVFEIDATPTIKAQEFTVDNPSSNSFFKQGADDLRQSVHYIYGNATSSGAKVRWFNSANEDTETDYYEWEAAQGFLRLEDSGGNLIMAFAYDGDVWLGGATDPTISVTTASQNLVLTTASGSVHIDDVLGVGTGDPDGTFHVQTGDASMTANSSADEAVFENNADSGIGIINPDASVGRIIFGTPTDTAGAFLVWDYSNDNLLVASGKTGASLILAGDNNKVNLTLSGTTGSELATFTKDITGPATWNIGVGVPTTINIGDSGATTVIGGILKVGAVTISDASGNLRSANGVVSFGGAVTNITILNGIVIAVN